jgi:DNA-binding transcriptional MocR family regulator
MMFDALAARAARRAEARAKARREALAEALADALPPGVSAQAVEEGVRLSGRGLRSRFARDAALRWLIAEKSR